MGIFDSILLASDIDGTLATGKNISKENIEAINYFIQNGGLFTLATGRAVSYIKNLNVPINAPVIAINGTLIYDTKRNKKLLDCTFENSKKVIAQEVLKNPHLSRISIFSFDEYFFENPTLSDFDKVLGPINKIVFAFDDKDAAIKTRNMLTEKYSPEFIFERSWPEGLEMRASNGGKGICLKYLKEYTGAKTTISVGDYENDKTLLLSSDISYCPLDAHEEILKIAKRTTAPHTNHAVAHIIYELQEKLLKGLDL